MNTLGLLLFLACLMNCGQLSDAKITNYPEAHFYIAILSIIGWGLFIIFLIGMLSGFCYWQQRRVKAMEAITRFHRTGLQHAVTQHEMRMNLQKIHEDQSLTANGQRIVVSPPENKLNTLQRHQAYISNGPTNYYPPSDVSLQTQGPRWSAAKRMPEF